MDVDINLFIKLQLPEAQQTDVKFNGDVKVSREMTLKKGFDVYKSSESNGFISTKKYRITKVHIAPDSLNIINIESKTGDIFSIDEVCLNKHDAVQVYAESLISKGLSMIRKGTTALVGQCRNANK